MFVNNVTIEDLLKRRKLHSIHEKTTITANNQTFQLTSASAYFQIYEDSNFTGTVVKMPDAQTLEEGAEYIIYNDCEKIIEVQDFDGNLISKLAKSGRSFLHLKGITDVNDNAGSWTTEATSAAAFSGTAPVLAYYGGQANSGRILEIVPSINSEDAPFITPTDGIIIAAVLGSGTGTASTCTVGIFTSTDLVNPILEISLAAETETILLDQEVLLLQLDKISARVTSGSIQKPYLTFYVTAT